MEWCLYASGTTLSDLASQKGTLRVWTYLQHKEDDMTMFGFSQEKERELFLSLLRVNGVGAKASLRILSSFNPTRLQEVLEREDINALSSVKGLGKKTAQKILLALKGKLIWADEETGGDNPWLLDILQSLVNMGFDAKKVQTVLKQVTGDADLNDLDDATREKQVFSRALLALSAGNR
jgi:Holliday junction DNA helicase RuvA